MIQKLLVTNFAIIDRLEINFSNHLTIITGETGAGKSILLGALGLIMGNRADGVSLYDPTQKCVVEAHFDVKNYDLKAFFDEHELDYDTEVVVRREITPAGKSRAFINDTPANLKALQQLSGSLIDLHLQFDTLDIHSVSFQLRMIDALAENKTLLASYQTKFRKYQSDRRKLQDFLEQSSNASKEMGFLNYQLEEFNKAELVEEEQERQEEELTQLSNAETIKRTLGGVARGLTEDDNALVSQLQDIAKNINLVKKFHKKIPSLYQKLDGLIYELQDISAELEQIADDTEYNGERINEIQERLNIIYKLQKKHNALNIKELLDIQSDLQRRLGGFGDLSETIEQLTQSIATQGEELEKSATELSIRRQAVVQGFQEKVENLLAQLSMEHAKLRVEVRPLPQLTSAGKDEVHFMFAPNKGSKFYAIKDTASGGELSRLTLVTKSLVASAIPLPTLIFDEIDTGISGDVALKMGNILQDLAKHHQVVSITHSPQIAAKAHAHYFVYKKILEDRTVTNIRALNPDERVRAIATMLSTSPPTAAALENARELLAR
jgi:DNA repair protein RecN (Recombination protein N)